MKGKCNRYQRVALNSVKKFSFFGPKTFSSISISGGRTDENEVSTVPTRYPEQCATIFVLRSKNFLFDISIFWGRRSERKV